MADHYDMELPYEERKRLIEENEQLKARLEALELKLGIDATEMADQFLNDRQAAVDRAMQEFNHSDRDALATAQARADQVYQLFGERALNPVPGESPKAYRIRLARKMQPYSAKCKNIKLDGLPNDQAVLDHIEGLIFADAAKHAGAENLARGRLVPTVTHDYAGRPITSYSGDMDSWLGAFKQPKQTIRLRRPPTN